MSVFKRKMEVRSFDSVQSANLTQSVVGRSMKSVADESLAEETTAEERAAQSVPSNTFATLVQTPLSPPPRSEVEPEVLPPETTKSKVTFDTEEPGFNYDWLWLIVAVGVGYYAYKKGK